MLAVRRLVLHEEASDGVMNAFHQFFVSSAKQLEMDRVNTVRARALTAAWAKRLDMDPGNFVRVSIFP